MGRVGSRTVRTKGKPGNTQIVTLALRNRSRAAHGWNNETLKVEHSGSGGPLAVEATQIIDPRSLEPEERAALRAFLLEQRPVGEADDKPDEQAKQVVSG